MLKPAKSIFHVKSQKTGIVTAKEGKKPLHNVMGAQFPKENKTNGIRYVIDALNESPSAYVDFAFEVYQIFTDYNDITI